MQKKRTFRERRREGVSRSQSIDRGRYEWLSTESSRVQVSLRLWTVTSEATEFIVTRIEYNIRPETTRNRVGVTASSSCEKQASEVSQLIRPPGWERRADGNFSFRSPVPLVGEKYCDSRLFTWNCFFTLSLNIYWCRNHGCLLGLYALDCHSCSSQSLRPGGIRIFSTVVGLTRSSYQVLACSWYQCNNERQLG